ncbi:zinc finger protein 622-like [Limulus polyphemus]|uniref:Zinc finger protein 622-like n=1 Tax=Limulus polyphemus TaxID=6850 RepID=A0ABM1BIH0_LIMPO|nr:zinc finger protein 622-like [Limulus polyphemus]
MSIFTCITCQAVFENLDIQRHHYKSDWHRYNLKRKVAELPPVTPDFFNQRVLAQRERRNEESDEETFHCGTCQKYFGTKNAYNNHVKSKKHQVIVRREKKKSVLADIGKQKVKNMKNFTKVLDEVEVCERDMENQVKKSQHQKSSHQQVDKSQISSFSDNVSQPLMHNEPLTKQLITITKNMLYRKSVSESQSVNSDSDWESCDDEEETRVTLQPNECLFCSYSSGNLEANVLHMSQEHSFFIPDIDYLIDLNGLITYLGEKIGVGFRCLWCCDKGKTFNSARATQQHMLDKGHCKMLHEGITLMEYSDFYDYSSSYPDKECDSDKEINFKHLDEENWQLVLPSGVSVGHRSLAHYYRQNVPLDRVHRNQCLINRVMTHYKTLGWTGTMGESAIQKARDIKFLKKIQTKHALKLALKNNKTLQPHFRHQIGF